MRGYIPDVTKTTRVATLQIAGTDTRPLVCQHTRCYRAAMGEVDDERDLIRAIVAGDREQFALLVERYQRYVFAVVAKRAPPEWVESIAHDTFVRAFRSLRTYRFEGPFRSWLAKTAIRQCLDFWRGRKRSRELPESALSDAQKSWIDQVVSQRADDRMQELAEQEECKHLLAMALARIPDRDRILLELVHLEERPVREVAELLGMSVSLVKVRAFRVRHKLRKIIESWLDEQDNE